MTKEKEVKGTAEPITSVKKRRGVSNETSATAQLKFSERDAKSNGLFLGCLYSVSVDYSTNAENKDFPSMPVPRLTLHFTSNHTDDKEKRHVYQSLFPVPSNVDTIPGGKDEWRVNNVFNWMKHILDVFYLKGRELTKEEEEALTLPFEDFDDAGQYVLVEPDDVLKGYGTIFNAFESMMNGSFKGLAEGETAKPCFKDANGKPVITWMKLLRHKKRKNEWINVTNGDLAFDTFIGSGVVELYKPNAMPSILSIDPSKESITPKEIKKAPNITAPGLGGIAPMGTTMVNPTFNSFEGSEAMEAGIAAGVETPF